MESVWTLRRSAFEAEEHLALRKSVRNIVSQFGHSYYMERSASGEAMHELWEMLGKHGFLGLNISDEYGGGGAGLTELAIVLEELSAGGCPELAIVLSPGIVGSILQLHGTPAQRQRYLPPLASGEERFAFALTEPDAGSNSHRLTTTATRDGDDWIVRGEKYYISGLDHSDHLLLVARTGEDAETKRGELTLFIVDEIDAPGIGRFIIPTALKSPERQYTMFFDDLRIPGDAVVGEVGKGLRPLFDGLNPERVLSAAVSTGVGCYAIEKAIRYANERKVWGPPIGAYQGIQHPMAEAAIELEAARALMWKAAEKFDEGLAAGDDANMAKYLASRAGAKALDTAIQVHGGNGLADEFELADLWGIMRLQQIAPVSTQMVLNYVAQHTLGLPRSY
jgi:alkylation response protein AidB-like acyl-CoA dehydrogenase